MLFFSDNLNEMLGDLILPCEMPEAPKQGFFKNLFGPSSVGLDREQLCKFNALFSYFSANEEINHLPYLHVHSISKM